MRGKINGYFKLKKLVKSDEFEFFMTIILLCNCTEVIAANFVTNDSASAFLDVADQICFYVYIIEFCLKIVGLGVEKYFLDTWNQFDFSMVVISICGSLLESLTSFLKSSANTVKSSKLLKLTRLNKLFRAFRACRTIKVVSFVFHGIEVLS